MKNIVIVSSIILIGVVGWIIFRPHDSVPNSQMDSGAITEEESSTKPTSVDTLIPETQTTPASVDTTKQYTSVEVGAHASAQSCWTIVNGKIYDLTSWISRHPGGSVAIKSICGVDGSDAFTSQHGGQSQPERELNAFYIGVLK